MTEGETVFLSTSVRTGGLSSFDYFRTDLFEIFTLQGTGNATGKSVQTLSLGLFI